MSKLLMDSNPLVIIPELAEVMGLNEAIFIQQLHYWIEKSNHFYDGYYWVYNSIPDWQKQFPFWSQSTLKRIVADLKKRNLIIINNYNSSIYDKTNWYTINYAEFKRYEDLADSKKSEKKDLQKIENKKTFKVSNFAPVQNEPIKSSPLKPSEIAPVQNEPTIISDWSDDRVKMSQPIPETTTEITTNIKNQSVSQGVHCEHKSNMTEGLTDDSLNDIQEYFKKRIGYTQIVNSCFADDSATIELLDEILLNILDMYYSDFTTVNRERKPRELIRSVLAKLDYWKISQVMTQYRSVTTEIKNIKGYLQTSIYNSVFEYRARGENFKSVVQSE